MREELRTIGSKGRHVFTATFVRLGFRNGYIGPVKTMLLQDVTLDSKIVSDHLWFDLTKDLVVLIYRQAMWLSFAQGLVLTRKDTRGTRMMYLIDR